MRLPSTMQPSDPTDGVQVITFDAVPSVGDDMSVTVTDHPVEDGADISDHIRDTPDKLTLDAIVSRTPIEFGPLLLLEDSWRHETAWDLLSSWLKAHVLLFVSVGATTYDNMAIESLTRSRTADVGEALQVSIKLKEIIKVVASEVAAPSRPAGQEGVSSDKGKVSATPAPPSASIGAEILFGVH
jgi:hypothetical protein